MDPLHSEKNVQFLGRLYEVKECFCDTPGVRLRERVRDQNVQFLRLGQFLSNFKG